MQVAPSIAAVRFVYELLVQEWGVVRSLSCRLADSEHLSPWIRPVFFGEAPKRSFDT